MRKEDGEGVDTLSPVPLLQDLVRGVLLGLRVLPDLLERLVRVLDGHRRFLQRLLDDGLAELLGLPAVNLAREMLLPQTAQRGVDLVGRAAPLLGERDLGWIWLRRWWLLLPPQRLFLRGRHRPRGGCLPHAPAPAPVCVSSVHRESLCVLFCFICKWSVEIFLSSPP